MSANRPSVRVDRDNVVVFSEPEIGIPCQRIYATRSVFDRYDITSEEDLAEASRKLQMIAGTITGTIGRAGADQLRDRLAKSGKFLGKIGGPPGDRTRDTVIKSHVLYH
jgi:hypothetical protein